MNDLKVAAHLESLQAKHKQLDAAIHEEMAHPTADDLLIKNLKQQKLAIKDEIARINNQSIH